MDFSAAVHSVFSSLILTYTYNVNLKRNQQIKKNTIFFVQEENVLPFAHVNFGNHLVRVTPLGLRFQSARSATQDET